VSQTNLKSFFRSFFSLRICLSFSFSSLSFSFSSSSLILLSGSNGFAGFKIPFFFILERSIFDRLCLSSSNKSKISPTILLGGSSSSHLSRLVFFFLKYLLKA